MVTSRTIFVTATNTDVGKTYACERLLNFYAKQGLKVGYFKPIETGVQDIAQDGAKLLALATKLNPSFHATLHDVVPYQFTLAAAPYVAKQNQKIDKNFLKEKQKFLGAMCDVLIIEGAGGLLVPIEKDFFIADLIALFNAHTILISPSNLGSINDTLLSMHYLDSKQIAYDWYINLYNDKEKFDMVTLPYYNDVFKKIKFLQKDLE